MKNLVALILFVSASASADIIIPTFYAHPTQRELYGEQVYHEEDVIGTLWQLHYWSNFKLVDVAMSQALNDVVSGKSKFAFKSDRDGNVQDVYHVSAGKDKATATLFFVEENGLRRIIGIARHVPVKINQDPIYEIISWDPRYSR